MSRSIPLNSGQLEILAWVRDGAPEDVYDDYRPRIVARALHNRGVVTVKGSGAGWSVTLTEDGSFYLDNGEYPAEPEQPVTTSSVRQAKTAAPSKPKPAPEQRAPKAPRVGPTDAMMAALAAAPDHRIEIAYEETGRYGHLAVTAERFKKIPDGMQVTVSHDYRKRTASVSLHPLPEWRTRGARAGTRTRSAPQRIRHREGIADARGLRDPVQREEPSAPPRAGPHLRG